MKYAVDMTFPDDPELLELISKYKRSLGWTWKRLFLVGVAESIVKEGNNPDLVLRIVNYLNGGE